MPPKQYTKALTIAGSDSGGAGIQADLKTFSALGCCGMSVITAMTPQNTQTVAGNQAAEPEFVAKQIDAVLDDIGGGAQTKLFFHTLYSLAGFHFPVFGGVAAVSGSLTVLVLSCVNIPLIVNAFQNPIPA